MRVQNARALRQYSTDAERLLRHHLRAQQLAGHKFRRQHPIGPYFADFACLPARLIVELDGGQHAHGEGLARDRQRTQFLHMHGWRVLRFWNNQVLAETGAVLHVIAQALAHPHPSPLPHAGEGAEILGHTS